MLYPRPGDEQSFLRYSLLVVSADGTTETFAVEEQPITIGRSPHATICLNDESVSRQHCMVTPAHGRLTMLDQGSTNGTRVNDNKVERARLSHGDTIRVGAAAIRVQARTGDAASAVRGPDVDPALNAQPPLAQEQLALLRRLAARLAVTRTPRGAARTLMEFSLEAFPAERAVVVTRGAAEVGAENAIFASISRDGMELVEVDPDLAVVKRVLASGRAERHLAALTATRPKALPDQRKPCSHPILCAPLRHRGEIVGVLYLDAEEMPDWVGRADSLALFSALADTATSAIALEPETPGQEESLYESSGQHESWPTWKVEEAKARMAGLEELDGEQKAAIAEMQESFEQRVEERAQIIEEQKIELAARLQEFDHLQQARAIMSRALVHDIRNQVGALEAHLSFVGMDIPPNSAEQLSLDSANRCARRVVAMAESVLDLSRMEDGTFPLDRRMTDVGGLLEEVVHQYEGQARRDGIALKLGELAGRPEVLADPDVLGRVVANLVDNALRYAGEEGSVTLTARQVRLAVEILVADTGPGVSDAERGWIFGEWSGAGEDRDNRHYGIGLYFCRMAVEAHGGSIRVEGESPDSRFVVSIPCADAGTEPEWPTTDLEPATPKPESE